MLRVRACTDQREREREREKERDARAGSEGSCMQHFTNTLAPSLLLSLFLSLTGEQGAHTLFAGQRERERGREGGRERKRVRKRERERIVTIIFNRNDGCHGTF
jgi:hypothetical protein